MPISSRPKPKHNPNSLEDKDEALPQGIRVQENLETKFLETNMDPEFFTFSEPITMFWAKTSVESSIESSMLSSDLFIMKSILDSYSYSNILLISKLIGALLVFPLLIVVVVLCIFKLKYFCFLPFLVYLVLMYGSSELCRQQVIADSKKFTIKIIELAKKSPNMEYVIKNSINDPLGWHLLGGSNGPYIHLTVSKSSQTTDEKEVEGKIDHDKELDEDCWNFSRMVINDNDEIKNHNNLSIADKKLPQTNEKKFK